MNKQEIGNLPGHFTWGWGNNFFIETEKGNFIWSDPAYPGGTNEITPFKGNYSSWLKYVNVPFGRDKGKHLIKDYCKNFTLKD